MHTVAKRLAELALCRSGVTRLARARRSAGTVVLAYHNVVPEGAPVRGDVSLHLPQREFARQLDLIRRTHHVVPLSALLEPRAAGSRPQAVITFDDACQGAVTAGVEEVARRGLPATIFVAPAFVDGRPFWWDSFAQPGLGLADEVRGYALDELRGMDDEVRRWAEERRTPAHTVPDHQRCASVAQLTEVDRVDGITLGSHTWSHANLARLEPDELEPDLVRPLAWLRERFRHVVPWLSYPYGMTSPRVAEAAARAGYAGALLVEGGWLARRDRERPDAYALPRQNIPAGLSLEGFELRISGLLDG